MAAKPTPRNIERARSTGPEIVPSQPQHLRLVGGDVAADESLSAAAGASSSVSQRHEPAVPAQTRTEEAPMSVMSVAAHPDAAADLRELRATVAGSAVEVLGLRDLLTRVEALLRRASVGVGVEPQVAEAPERFGDVEVYLASRTVLRRGQLVTLSPTEFHLLLALLRRRGALATRDELLREVWEGEVDRNTRRVDMSICRLRQKLEDNPAIPRHIVTVLKAGYRLRP